MPTASEKATARRDRPWERLLDLDRRGAPEYVRSAPELAGIQGLGGSVHLMRRAWDDLDIDGLFLSNRQPALYIRTADDDRTEACRLHRVLWNQGICPALALITPTEVKVYSGLALPTDDPDRLDDDGRLVETFKHADMALRHLTLSIEEGQFLADHPKSFNPAHRVDRCLLANLKSTRARLLDEGGLDEATADALLTRAVFCCYLVDRKIIDDRYFAAVGTPGVKNLRQFLAPDRGEPVARLYERLFERLRRDFNGDMFADDLDDERKRVSPRHVELIRRLLTGEDVLTGQQTLGFWAYDFSAIPIETISAIYQEFLSLAGAQHQRQRGAYYTPRTLADVTLDMALEGVSNLTERTFLDPSCGSGIFLVGLFNRMADELRRRKPNARPAAFADRLKDLLRHQLYGVDVDRTACRITAFSLYLALLDQLEPRDIRTLQRHGHFLPNLLRGEPGGTGRTAGTIIPADFFAENLALRSEGFDAVVGNPPWSEIEADSPAEKWCRQNGLQVPQKQHAAAFVWKTARHLRAEGKACFVLPLKLLTYAQKPGLEFQRRWLSSFDVEKVLNLADMGFHLFEGAAHPAMIARFAAGSSQLKLDEKPVEYMVARSETETLKTDVITVSPDDRHRLKVRRLLRELDAGHPPRIWKQALWGTPRDRAFLDRLADFPTLGARVNGELGAQGWAIDEGFNRYAKGKPTPSNVLTRSPFLHAEAIVSYIVPTDALQPRPPTTEPNQLNDERVYLAPHVVMPHGVSRRSERMDVAYSAMTFSFTHSVRGIHAPEQDSELLRFLCCALASPFAQYFLFHTAANWGTERPKIHIDELKEFPFPDADSPDRKRCVAEAAKLHRQLERACAKNFLAHDALVDEYGSKLDRLVLEFYGVDDWEEALIADTVRLWIPSATPHRNTGPRVLESSTDAERQTYVRQLLECLNTWAKGGPSSVTARVVRCHAAGLGIVHLTRVPARRGHSAVPEEDSPDELDRILDRVRGVLDYGELNLRYRRNLKVFAGEDLYILKPLSKRYWCRTAAINDADEIAAAILSQRGGKT